jgi:H+-translocating NAD(P) transhydrogenase subunit alpha
MRVGIPKETTPGEQRVAMVPDVVKRLSKKNIDVVVESGAGESASVLDDALKEAGATIASSPDEVWQADVVAKVRAPSAEEIGKLKEGGVLVAFLAPLTDPDTSTALAKAGVTAFAMEAIPRTTRAQSMDALSSQATVAGYRAVLIAGLDMGRFFPMLTTAAGTIKPASVLVLGAGVAGLQAIATARRLGAVVTAFDVRSAVKEQINSLGAKFLEFDLGEDAEGEGGYARELTPEQQKKQQEELEKAIQRFDVVITTALIPGRPAPKLVTETAVKGMKPGSVIVDLAGEAGGNCELTKPGETIVEHDVTIASPLNLPSDMPDHASQLYARNIMSLLELMAGEEGALELNWEDDILAGAVITRDGEIVHEGAKKAAGTPAAT